ncbi:hypothetical protein NKI48_03195 [Mesorhizobium sp. M0644]|uniref:hypothetical protein n=1 Tax=Mesorhizobium sp. M0644 TaxID=2956979 RepID=UPI00333C1898
MSAPAELIERANRVSRALITTGDPTIVDELLARIALLKAENARLVKERDRCHERLEIDHHFVMVGENQLERREIPIDQRAAEPDGIEARDCTIALQDSRIASLEAEREALKEALAQIGVVCSDNAPETCRHDLALKLVADVAARALLPRQDRLSEGEG